MQDAAYTANVEINNAIERSISHDEIVTLPWTEARETALLAAQDDGVDAGEAVEAWGEEPEGTWRVHLARESE